MSDVIKEVLDKKSLKDLKKVEVAKVKTKDTLSEAKVEEVIELLKDVENNNGHLNIAEMAGVSVEKVKEIHKKMEERIAELQTETPEIEDLPVMELPKDIPLDPEAVTK